MGRTFAIGDVHGDRVALDRLLARLPWIAPEDTLLFLGDYLDRGPDSAGVVERLRRLPEETAGQIVLLRGNHEDMWIECLQEPDLGFLLPRGNGCAETYRSYTGGPALTPHDGLDADEILRYYDVKSWLPSHIGAWLASTVIWHEDDHAIYVHAGLQGEGSTWRHPRESPPKVLMWMREPDFFANYDGKPLVFGHTRVDELPPEDKARRAPWRRGPLWGLDTGAGRGGPLSCVALPDGEIFSSE